MSHPFLEQTKWSEMIQPLVSNETKRGENVEPSQEHLFIPQREHHTQLAFTGERDLKDLFAPQNLRAEEGLKRGSN